LENATFSRGNKNNSKETERLMPIHQQIWPITASYDVIKIMLGQKKDPHQIGKGLFYIIV
jgi:hypothetical protein